MSNCRHGRPHRDCYACDLEADNHHLRMENDRLRRISQWSDILLLVSAIGGPTVTYLAMRVL